MAVEAFSAVVTTGIYCRPGCAGRPRRDHVREFGLAAAAEAAGFRACLRCRPYRSAHVVSWSGPELVCRAVQLIIDGALDDGTEAALGARLGVSGRHLRRLFTAHLGVTPDGLARSRRAHFARRLLDDTDLTVTDIAFASGFGSIRQLNRALREVFRASPRELRARRHASDRLVADGGLALRLPFSGPLEWDAMLAYLAPRAIPGIECVAGDTYRRSVVIDAHPGVLELFPHDDGHLVLQAHLPHWEDLMHIVDRARRIPNLDIDMDEPNGCLAGDPTIGPLVHARPGLRPPGTWDPFENAVRAIIGQQVTIAGATTIAGRLVQQLGTPVPGLGQLGLTHTFPSAETIAGADLSELGLTPARAQSIRAFAQAVLDDSVRLDRSVELDQLIASITAIPGLGPWTAHYIALRLGEPDAFPATDLGLRQAFSQLRPRTTATLAQLAEHWRPWRAFAATHLWKVAQVGRQAVNRVTAHKTPQSNQPTSRMAPRASTRQDLVASTPP